MYSNSRGSLKIKSKDPFEKPSIVFNFSTKEDEQEWVEAIRVARNILAQKQWIHIMEVKFHQDHRVQTDEEILDWVRRDGENSIASIL